MASAIVRIWWFGGSVKQAAGAGHGSVEIPNPPTYITWAPETPSYNIFAARARNPRLGPGSLAWGRQEDELAYGGPAQVTIAIPLRGDGNLCGLDAPAMALWWTNLTAHDRSYRLFSKEFNCDATTFLALQAGGAERYVEALGCWFVRGAQTLKRWAVAVRDAITDMNLRMGRAEPTLRHVLAEAWDHARPVWTPQRWQTESAVLIGKRRDQVARIDHLLPVYQAALAANNELDQHRALYDILGQVLDHLEQKRTSDRRTAVARLGRQVHDRLCALSALNVVTTGGMRPRR
jgi:hypothetical protein